MEFKALKWIGDIEGYLELIDQRLLPAETKYIKCEDIEQLYNCIKTLAVRGAPAIGVSAAFGLAIAMQNLPVAVDLQTAIDHLKKGAEYLSTSRPTAVNLFWALDRMKIAAKDFASQNPKASMTDLKNMILSEAKKIEAEDIEMCDVIGTFGRELIKEGFGVLTHCNAGALATAGIGTALAPMFKAKAAGNNFTVYVDETRPLLQGARLTAWELTQADIESILICDNMAGWLMKQGNINMVITGADRIAANGDTANKIGTYSLSILAKEHNIPFYIAAPSSTFDFNIKNGREIPIEQRNPQEVKSFASLNIAPEKVRVSNPAFDVTDARNITAIITEKGIIEKPNTEKIANCLKSKDRHE